MTNQKNTSTNILDNHQIKLVEANQKLLDELLADKLMQADRKIVALSNLVVNAQALKNLGV